MTQDPIALASLARDVGQDFVRVWRQLLAFDILFQLLRAWLVAPVMALILAFILLRAGHVAVSNQDIIGFLLTPWGVLYAAVLAVLATFLHLLEHAGLLAVAALAWGTPSDNRWNLRRPLSAVPYLMWQVGRLGVAKICCLCVAFAPFVALACLTYFLLLTRYDIYYYLNSRPTAFWLAAGIGTVIGIGAGVLGMVLFVRWSLAVPLVVLEGRPGAGALAASRQLVNGAAWSIGTILIGWLLLMLGLGAVALAGFRWFAAIVLLQLGNNSLLLLGALLIVQEVLLAVMSFLSAAGLALIVRRIFWLRRSHQPVSVADDRSTPTSPEIPATAGWPRTALWVSAAVVVISPLFMWAALAHKVARRPTVLVTAHRGLAKHAPENTLIALQKAIDVGADYAEIDVHQTRDGVVVLLHDRDLRRVAGDSRRLDQLTFAEVRELDVGSWFAPEFAAQRTPTLVEAIELCRGRIRLNIELKVFGAPEPLAQAVAQIVREQHFETQCIVTSLSHEALIEVRRHAPDLPVGLIVGQSIGDVNRLQVDALSVRADHLSDAMIRAAHLQSRQVMVWGMDGERQMLRQLQRGVDNLITSDPEPALQLRDRWQAYSDSERLAIALRLLLTLQPQ